MSLCVICMNVTRLTDIGSCSHQFCTSCVELWLAKHNTCPMCRCVVSNNNRSFLVKSRTKSGIRTFFSDDNSLQRLANLVGI